MKKIIRKLRSSRGETLVEILVGILIIALAASLFASMYSVSMSIDMQARAQDEALYKAMGELEAMFGPNGNAKAQKGTVLYETEGGGTSGNIDVDIITEAGMTAYSNYTGSSGAAGGTP